MKRLLKIMAATIGISTLSGTAFAEFPDRNLTNIFPWGPGTAMSVSQIVADALGDELGVSVPVVSTTGAAGTKAFKTAMSKPADGYTIFDGYVAPLVLQPVLGNADWTYSDFTPLWGIASNAFSIVGLPNETRWSNFEELVAYAKENPGKLRYSPNNRNALPHMVMSKIFKEFEMVAKPVPYKNQIEALKDMEAGLLDFIFFNPGHYVQNKDRVKVLLVMSELDGAKETYGGAENIKDLGVDIGLSGLVRMGWTWWLVKKGTPEDRVQILRDALKRALDRESVQNGIKSLGFVPLLFAPEDYTEIVGPVGDQLLGMKDALAWEEEQLSKY